MHRRQPCHSSRHGKNSPSALFINYVEQHGGHFTVSIQTHQLYFLSLAEIPQHVGRRARLHPTPVSCPPPPARPEASLQERHPRPRGERARAGGERRAGRRGGKASSCRRPAPEQGWWEPGDFICKASSLSSFKFSLAVMPAKI